jgi:hypothetical protein
MVKSKLLAAVDAVGAVKETAIYRWFGQLLWFFWILDSLGWRKCWRQLMQLEPLKKRQCIVGSDSCCDFSEFSTRWDEGKMLAAVDAVGAVEIAMKTEKLEIFQVPIRWGRWKIRPAWNAVGAAKEMRESEKIEKSENFSKSQFVGADEK